MPAPTPPKPPLSPAKLAANRANARKSTGPKTAEGKARSRANATTHGLAAQVAPTPELESAYRDRVEAYEAILRPDDDLETDLVHAAAWGAARFELARRRQLRAAQAEAARATFAAQSTLEAAIARLQDDPVASLRTLTASAAGVAWMIDAWTRLRQILTEGRPGAPDHWRIALALLGRTDRPGSPPPSLNDPETLRRLHDPGALLQAAASALRLDRPEAPLARKLLLRLADEQIARLEALHQALAPIEPDDPATSAPEPPWHRYEAAARAAWFGALTRLRAVQADRRRADPNEPNPARPTPLAATPAGTCPEAAIAALRAGLRAMAHRHPNPNEPNPAPDPPPTDTRDVARSPFETGTSAPTTRPGPPLHPHRSEGPPGPRPGP